jgi:GNAT superfamily N-acetyltransferase
MHIRQGIRRDVPDTATIGSEAQIDADTSALAAPYRYQYPDSWRQNFLRRQLVNMHDGHTLLVMVSDKDDPWWNGHEVILGYTFAISTEIQTKVANRSIFTWDSLELWLTRKQNKWAWDMHLDRSIDREAYMRFGQALSSVTALDNIKPCWDLSSLSVSPPFQRKGIGKALTKAVQDLAAKDGLPVVLTASTVGYPMYKQMGFVEVGLMHFVPGRPSPCMVWYPPKTVANTKSSPRATDVLELPDAAHLLGSQYFGPCL